MTDAEDSTKACFLPNAHLTKKLLDLGQQSCNHKQLWKGANEATCTLKRGILEFTVIAADPVSLDIILISCCSVKTRMCPMCSVLKAGAGVGLGSSGQSLLPILSLSKKVLS